MCSLGKVIFKIDDVLKIKSISKNELEKKAGLQRTQLNSYSNNKVKRVDLDVLARICCALDVSVSDVLEYIPSNKLEEKTCQK